MSGSWESPSWAVASSPEVGRRLSPQAAITVDGHAGTLLSTGLHDVVVWTDGSTWFAVATPHGVGGVTATQLELIARSMHTVG